MLEWCEMVEVDMSDPWIPVVTTIERALGSLPSLKPSVIYRSVQALPGGQSITRKDIVDTLSRMHIGAILCMVPFQSCTPDIDVAVSWTRRKVNENEKPTCGIIYKYIVKSCARDISEYTVTEWQKEAVTLPRTKFRVTAHLHVSTLFLNNQSTTALSSDMEILPNIETDYITPMHIEQPHRENNVPDVVVIVMEEM